MRPSRTRSSVRPAVRLRAAPPLDPPFDDESAASFWSRHPPGQLTLDLPARPAGRVRRPLPVGPRGGASTGPDRAGGASGRDAAVRPDGGTGSAPLPPGALAGASPEARQAAKRFLGTCLEILNGYRPAAQIRPLTSPVDATTIIEQLTAAVARLAARRSPRNRRSGAVRLRLLRVCEPCAGVVEAAAVLGTDDRTWAMVFRLERRQGSWVGTETLLL
jgi:hypothetical protein